MTDLKEGAILFAEFCGERDVVALVLLDEVAEEGLLAAPHLVAPPVGLHHGLDLLAQPVDAPLLEDHAVADRALMDDILVYNEPAAPIVIILDIHYVNSTVLMTVRFVKYAKMSLFFP